LARHQENRLYIHCHSAIPVFLAQFEDRSASHDSGVVEEHVDSAKFSHGSFDCVLAIGGTGNINVLEDGSTALPNNFLSYSFSGLIDVGNSNRGAFASEEQGRCASDAACSAGDESDSVSQGSGFSRRSHGNGVRYFPQRLKALLICRQLRHR
jgi:hypothetical protein